MEAMRITQKPKDGLITIHLPNKLRNQKLVEVIILPYEEKSTEKKDIDPKNFKGSINLNMTIDEIDQECKNMRTEWERGF